jgi:hypothetical protein
MAMWGLVVYVQLGHRGVLAMTSPTPSVEGAISQLLSARSHAREATAAQEVMHDHDRTRDGPTDDDR